MKTNHKTAALVLLIYACAIFFGAIIFLLIDIDQLIVRLLIADVAMTLMIWIFSMVFKNASMYDPYWSVIPPALILGVIVYFDKPMILSIGLLFIGLLLWSVRLTYNWASNWEGLKEMDWRYTMLYHKNPKLYVLTNLLGIHMFPTLIVFIQLIGGVYLVILEPSVNIYIWIGFFMMVSAALIQLIADQQMKNFKYQTKGQKLCIEEGLWKYSRHPNYFGEIILWWGLYVMYFGSTMQLDILFMAPIAMTAMFLFISIPMMEKKILHARPEYKAYQERVSMLIPFIRKEDPQTVAKKNA